MAFTPRPKQTINYEPPVARNQINSGNTNLMGLISYTDSQHLGVGTIPIFYNSYSKVGYFRGLSAGTNINIFTGSTTSNPYIGSADTINIALNDNITVSNLSATTYFSGSTPLETAITYIVNNIAASGVSPFQLYGTSSDWNITNINPSSFSIIGSPRYSFFANGIGNIISQSSPYNSIFNTVINGQSNSITEGNYHCIIAGRYNVIAVSDTKASTVVNGSINQIKSSYGLIGNGNNNYIKAGSNRATILNGYQNIINSYGHFSSILAGYGNQLNSPYSTIVNGKNNVINAGLTNVVLLNVDNYTATQSNTVVVDKLNVQSVSTGGDLMLTYDSVTGNVNSQPIQSGNTSSINNGINTFTAGTNSFQSVNVTGLTIDSLIVSGISSVNSISATTYYSGSTNLGNLFIVSGNTTGGGEPIFSGKFGNFLNFKSIAAGSNVTLNSNASLLTINAIVPAGANIWTVGNGASSIMANNSNTYAGANYSLVAGRGNYVYSNCNYSSIVNGLLNKIKTNSYNSSILGGNYNYISYSTRGVIASGYMNRIYTNNATHSNDSFIGAGLNNLVINSFNSSILNGLGNSIINAPFATILNGNSNLITATGATIINGSNITATTNNMVYVDKFNIKNLSTGGDLMLTYDSANGNVHTQAIPSGGTSGVSSYVNNGINTFTAGTSSFQSVNVTGLSINNIAVSGESSFTSISATTYYSGSTNLSNLFAPKVQHRIKTVDQTTISSSTVPINEMTFDIESGKKYYVDYNLLLSGTTGGMRFGLSGNTLPKINVIMQGVTSAINAQQSVVHKTNGLSNQTIASTASVLTSSRITGLIECTGATGTISLVWRTLTAPNLSTLLEGSVARLETIN